MDSRWTSGSEHLPSTRTTAERVVREQRFTIAVVVPVVGSLLVVADAAGMLSLPGPVAPLLLLMGALVMRLPLLVAIGPLVDRRAGAHLLWLTAFVYAVEFVGVTTGWPYGGFHYGRELGPMLFGTVPLGLPLFFLPLVIDVSLLTQTLLGRLSDEPIVRLITALGLLLAVDFVLDPGAVAVNFWMYDPPGEYYGVPVSNYAGWLLTGTVALVVVDRAFDRNRLGRRLRECEFALDDLVSFGVFWGLVNLAATNWIPVAIAACLLAVLYVVGDD